MATFQKRGNGKWQAKIRRNGWPEQSKSFSTKATADSWARAVEREMDIGAFINRDDAERTTFEAAADRYETEILSTKKGIPQGRSDLKKLKERFGQYSLASINPAMISAYRDDRLKAVSAQTVVHELGMMSRVFKACALDWGIALPQGIPTALVRKPRVANARDRRLEPGEWELLRAALLNCKSPLPLAAVELAIETAGRQSELISLTWADVDVHRRVARLRGTDGGTTKNNDTFRDVPLSSRALAILSGLPRAIKGGLVLNMTQDTLKQAWERSVERARKNHHRDLLRKALAESGLDEKSIAAEIRALIYKKKNPSAATVALMADIELTDQTLVDFRFHDLRHEGISRLAEKLQMHELMKVAGHKSSALLARYYHPRASDLAAKLG